MGRGVGRRLARWEGAARGVRGGRYSHVQLFKLRLAGSPADAEASDDGESPLDGCGVARELPAATRAKVCA